MKQQIANILKATSEWKSLDALALASVIADGLTSVGVEAAIRRGNTGAAWKRLLTTPLPATIGTGDIQQVTGLTRGAIRKWLMRYVPPLPERVGKNEWQWDRDAVLRAVRAAKGSGNRLSQAQRAAVDDQRCARHGP
jgi:hypothetical protein